MKIVAGLGSIDEYIRFAEAGADEFFCGYVPYSWSKKYGTVMPLNRREVLCYNVQVGAFSELEILSKMVEKYKKTVHLTFNSLYYIPQQYPEIARIIQQCMSIGFRSYIIADPALVLYLREQNIPCEIHLSGETGEINSQMVKVFQKLGLKRVIFHRKNTFEDMKAVVDKCKNQCQKQNYSSYFYASKELKEAHGSEKYRINKIDDSLEFEAFALNEMCQFTGAFCNSLHCDEMGYLCRVPYELGKIKTSFVNSSHDVLFPLHEMYESSDHVVACDKLAGSIGENDNMDDTSHMGEDHGFSEDGIADENGYLCGQTGCGLCALYQLKQAGITHLKLVGRGNYTDYMEKDIRNLRMALEILETAEEESVYLKNMKSAIFPDGCSRNCYYR